MLWNSEGEADSSGYIRIGWVVFLQLRTGLWWRIICCMCQCLEARKVENLCYTIFSSFTVMMTNDIFMVTYILRKPILCITVNVDGFLFLYFSCLGGISGDSGARLVCVLGSSQLYDLGLAFTFVKLGLVLVPTLQFVVSF